MTIRQLAFVNEYLLTGNAAEAYGKVYRVENKQVARVNACRLLANVSIQNYIRKHQQKMEKKTTVTVERVIAELAKIGFANIQDFITADNQVQDLSTVKRSKAAAVSQIKTRKRIFRKDGEETETVETEFRLHDKIAALEKLGKHLGAFISIKDLIDRMDETTTAELLDRLMEKLKDHSSSTPIPSDDKA